VKLKLSILVMQGNEKFDPLSNQFLTIVVDENGDIPSSYVSTKTIEETIQQLYDSFSNLDCRWASPVLSDLRHKHGSTESEALYRVLVPEGAIGLKKGELTQPHLLNLEPFYERSITEQPRAISQF
jgi:hypothetical protein